ncbi:non-structural maintenance of chromosomes element 4 homolog A [Monomorium pharaonis]|uniref:non-structural maintenance of chromosomes element 4 homolog A n=1 Tax=Monomorium pharaonis TaxID=307658 RepID=UPI00063F64A1|nr:non-structural maintenance of chromosomes element 4 homolog A [Monomorium pharaonis]XP_012541414.1 non-structural maintenance of chromosomes element 4 homolog A [Monomorium pharaonis]
MSSNKDSINSLNSTHMRSPKERKNCLKRALQQTLILQEVINDSTINKLDEAINEVDHVTYETSIQEKVSNQQEVLIDSQMMTSSSKVLKTCTVSLTKKMRDYDHIDFSQKLIKHLQQTSKESQSPNWSLLERLVTKLFKRVANSSTLLGTLDPLEKKTITRKKPEQRIASQAAVKIPDKVVPNTNKNDEDSVERTVRKIKKLITCHCKETGKPLDFFQLILHPHDFGRTIRNMLYISFLVKDGVVELKKDNKTLTVEPCRKETNTQRNRSGDRLGIQSVISLNMEQWKMLTKAYKLEQPMIDFDEEK